MLYQVTHSRAASCRAVSIHHSGMMAAVRYAASTSPRRHRPPASAATEKPSDTGNIIRLHPKLLDCTTSTGPATPACVGELLLRRPAPKTISDNGHNTCRFQANTSSPSMTLLQKSPRQGLRISNLERHISSCQPAVSSHRAIIPRLSYRSQA